MEFIAAGTGSAFTMKNWQSNFVVRQNEKCLLIDCGGDIRQALAELNIPINELDVYIYHMRMPIILVVWNGWVFVHYSTQH